MTINNISILTCMKQYVIFVLRKDVHMNNLRIIREIYGITQDEIAKAININRATIST